MPQTITATDRKALIRLASTLPKGSEERKAILAGIDKVAQTTLVASKETFTETQIVFQVMSYYKGHPVQPDPESFEWGKVQSRGPNIEMTYTMKLESGERLEGWVATAYTATSRGVTVETHLELAG